MGAVPSVERVAGVQGLLIMFGKEAPVGNGTWLMASLHDADEPGHETGDRDVPGMALAIIPVPPASLDML